MTISEDRVLESLRDALAGSAEVWRSARYVSAQEAERSGRTIVAAAHTTEFGAIRDLHGIELRPYGVHHHVLIVGWTPCEAGVRTDPSRFAERPR